ncbi:hypothetical protein [Salinicoccus roseus]|uniref:hypothetical protein n=1 Tax=Salinicoccus roseus TaxID=45670 RepID=UPI003DA0B033
MNDEKILQYGEFNSNQIFFIQRWSELLHSYTHSRYSIRYLNVNQALIELDGICKGMLKEEVKRNKDHLKITFKEAYSILEKDKIFKNRAPSYYKILNNTLQQSPDPTKNSGLYSVIYQLEYVMRYVEKYYLDWVIDYLESLLFNDEEKLVEVEETLKILASELVGKGWSVNSLWELGKAFYKKKFSEEKRFSHLFDEFRREEEEYIFLFTIKDKVSNDARTQLKHLDIDFIESKSILQQYEDYNLQNISHDKEYIRSTHKCQDRQSGVNKAWEEISRKVNIINFYGFQSLNVDTSPIILMSSEKKYYRNIRVKVIEEQKKFQAPEPMMFNVRTQLKRGDPSINRKIENLFEFTKISEDALAPQSTFLNLWIATESFVQSKNYDGGIENVKNVISASSTKNYIYGLVKNFVEDCGRCSIVGDINGKSIYFGKLEPKEMLEYFMDEGKAKLLLKAISTKNTLLVHRFLELKDILKNNRKCSDLLENHKNKIDQHIHRLYRIRNSIVHSGEMEYKVNLFTKHLHEYIQQLMSIVFHRLNEEPDSSLEDIFTQTKDSVQATIEVLKQSKEMDKDSYYDLLLNGAF